ncbi:MAG: DUF2490 domain-containing protein [Flavobacteriales bacterium]|nr:DUF2490 domain-containing protein [Flavobacteriales bacterium]
MNSYKTIMSCLILIIGVQFKVSAQDEQIDHNFNSWWSNINKYHLGAKTFLSSELHIRRTNGLDKWQQFLFRPAVNYKVNDHLVSTVGYTFIQTYPYGNQPIVAVTPEHNVWEQVTLKHNIKKVNLSHRFRMEHRFIGQETVDSNGQYRTNGFNYAQRFRYRFTGQFPLSKNQKVFGKWFDEIWLNLSNSFMPRSLNQNWLYLGVGYRFSDIGNVQVGFMDQLIKKGDGVHYENNPTIQCSVSFELGRKKIKK